MLCLAASCVLSLKSCCAHAAETGRLHSCCTLSRMWAEGLRLCRARGSGPHTLLASHCSVPHMSSFQGHVAVQRMERIPLLPRQMWLPWTVRAWAMKLLRGMLLLGPPPPSTPPWCELVCGPYPV